ncbi:MAG: amino acid ABC transporter permease [Alphaproteobacteria bacterium]|nr:amino acid ABC transporter permease [Alphaproteobacteria bacterium]
MTGGLPMAAPAQRPPLDRVGALRWLRVNLFSGPLNTLLTLVTFGAIALVVPAVLRWAVVDAVWRSADPAVCRAAAGACWAVVAEKHRLMLFGLYPHAEHWRPVAATVLYVAAVALTCWPGSWRRIVLVPLWTVTVAVFLVLMLGGALGLSLVETREWGGLPLTVVVFTATVMMALPLGIILALGRRSRLPLIRTAAIGLIEIVRGVPLVTVLFCAAVVFPLFLPPGWDVDKLVRVLVAMGIFYGCYFAEVIRGGLQAIPKGQHEAAASLGLSYWQSTRKIVLPQALRVVIPGLMNHVISVFKNSTLVIVVGLFDMLYATTAAIADPLWIAFYTEGYLFVGAIYFLGCWAMSRYSQFIERRLARGRSY